MKVKKHKTKLNPSKFKEQYILKPYRAIVDIYTKKHFDEKVFNKSIKEFASMLKLGDLVLDAGCGPGGETKKLLSYGLKVKSIDICPEMLQQARKLVPQGEFINMDITNLDFPNAYFKGLWSTWTLIHISKKQLSKVLAGFNRVLKRRGIACLITLEGKGEGIEPEYYDKTGKTKTFFKYFQEGELEKELEKQGFKVIKSERIYRGKEKEPSLVTFVQKI